MKAGRAHQILAALAAGNAEGDARELAELEKQGLVLRLDAPSLEALDRYEDLRSRHAELDPFAADKAGDRARALGEVAARLDRRLRSDWHRFRAKRATIAREEEDRVWARRLAGLLVDARRVERLAQTARPRTGGASPPAPRRDLGTDLLALTHEGAAAGAALRPRLARYAPHEFAAFLKAFRKASAKMRGFARDVATLREGVGGVPKGREHVLASLLKADASAEHLADAYARALGSARAFERYDAGGKMAPHTAALFVRQAAADRHFDLDRAARELAHARSLLLRAGHPDTPTLRGAAKALLPSRPPDLALPRFNELAQQLQAAGVRGDPVYKFIVRLMPARGSPAEVVARAAHLARLPAQRARRYARASALDEVSVALASMARDGREVDALGARFYDVERAFVELDLPPWRATALALSCVGCPGSPAEVVALVRELAGTIGGRGPDGEALSLAAAFAKRFAY